MADSLPQKSKSNKSKVLKIFLSIIFLFAFFSALRLVQVMAFVSPEINFQGKLTNANGVNVTDGYYDFRVRIYDNTNSLVVGGDVDITDVRVSNGIFNLKFSPSATILSGGERFIQVCFNSSMSASADSYTGGIDGTAICNTSSNDVFDKAFSPRKKITSNPYSLISRFLGSNLIEGDSAGNLQVSGNTSINGNLTLGGSTTLNGNTYTWPTIPTAGVLVNDGLGGLSWTAPGACVTCFVNNGNSFGGNSSLGNNDNFALSLKTNNISRLYIENNGNIGVGNTTPGATFDVTGTGRFSGVLTASNGFTQTTGALNLTATSGAITLSGLAASSISTGANNLIITSGNFNTTATGINNTVIGAITPTSATFTNLSSNGIINLIASSGSLSLNGLSTSSISTGANNLLITAANFNTTSTGINNSPIGTTTPSTASFTSLSANSTVTFSGLSTNTGSALCLNGSSLVICSAGTFNQTLQQTYNNSTNPELTLDSTRGALTIRDNSTPLGANLFEVQNNSGATTYFGVAATGATISNGLTLSNGSLSLTATTGALNLTGLSTSTLSTGANNLLITSGNFNTTATGINNTVIGATTRAAGNFTNLDASGTLNISGNSTLGGILSVDGSTTLNSSLSVSGTTLLNNALGVTGVTTLSSVLNVGGTGEFQINASGNITKINNVTYSFPASQAGGAGYTLINDGSGNLSWQASGGACPTCYVDGGNSFGADATIGTNDNFSLALKTNNINRLYIDNAGNVGIGNSLPGAVLDVTGTGRFSGVLTASNGFTQTTGALNLTATSGTLTLSGLSASSISTGANNLLITSGNFNATSTGINNTVIGATTAAAGTFTNLTANGVLNLTSTSGALTLNGLSASTISTGVNNLLITAGNLNLTSTGINNTAIGATTASSGAFTTLSASSSVTFSGLATNTGSALCLNGTSVVICSAGLFNQTMQQTYNNSTNPELTLDATRGALTIRDNVTPIGSNLFEIQNNSGATTYFGVTATGTTVANGLTLSNGSINLTATSGALNLTGLSASTLSTGANNLLITSGNFNTTATGINNTVIGATTAAAGTFTNLTATGTLNVTGASTLGSTLSVTGGTTLSSTLSVSGATTVNNSLGVTGITTLSNALNVGGTSEFQIDATGNITKINNITYSFPASQAAGAGYILVNDGSGNLSWQTTPACSTCYVNGGNSFGGNSTLGTNDNFSLALKTNNTNRLYIDNSGNVGIGNSLPGAVLDVTGTGRFSGVLTASNGFTQTTGALNLTATSGAITLSGLSASSISTGANNLLITSGNITTTATGINNTVIGATTAAAGTFTNLTANGALNLTATSGALSLSGLSSSTISTGVNNLLITAGNLNVTSTGINSTAIGSTTASSGAFTTLSASSSVTFSGLATNTGSALCLNGTSVVICTAGLFNQTMQQTYDNSTNPELTLDSTRGALTVRDNATPIGSNLFEIQNNSGATTYFGVSATGTTLRNGLTLTNGSLNLTATSGAISLSGITSYSISTGANNATFTSNNFNVTANGINNTAIGVTTRAAGNFTTLSANSTLGVTGAATLSSTLNVSGITTLNNALGVSGITTLSNILNVGGSGEFQVDATGNITKINNITYSFPASQAAGAGYVLSNNGSGTLSWVDPTTLGTNYWTLNGNDLYANSTSYLLGIGTTNPAYSVDVASTSDRGINLINTNSADTGNVYGIYSNLNVDNSYNQYSGYFLANNTNTGGGNAYGIYADATTAGGGIGYGVYGTGTYYGVYGEGKAGAIGVYGSGYAGVQAVATEDNGYAGYFQAGPVDSIGVMILQPSASASSYAIYASGGKNYFSGVTGIGAMPNAAYSLNAGSAINAGSFINATGAYRLNNSNILRAGGDFNSNLFVGWNAGPSTVLTAGGATLNTFVGNTAGQANTTGYANTFVGAEAGLANTIGHTNSFFGTDAGASNTNGIKNVLLGAGSGFTNTSGSRNVLIGNDTGYYLGQGGATPVEGNTFLGHQAGVDITSGEYNTLIGYGGIGASTGMNGLSYATAVGALAKVEQSHSLVLGIVGGANPTKVGIGDTTPANLFTVGNGDLFQIDSNGDIVKLKNLTYSWPTAQASGILTNNGSGTLSWAAAPSCSTCFTNGGNSFTANATLGTNDAFSLALKTNNANRVTIDSAGLVGIGGAPVSGVALNVAGTISSPGAGTNSERFGYGATSAGVDSTAFGYNATASGLYSVAIGRSAVATQQSSVSIGYDINNTFAHSFAIGTQSTTSGLYAVAIGTNSEAGAYSLALGRAAKANTQYSMALGYEANVAGFSSMVIGSSLNATAANQLVIGSGLAGFEPRDVYIGMGITNSNASVYGGTVINATGGAGTDVAGANLTLAGGKGTGTGAGGSLIFRTAAAGSTGSTLNALTTRMVIASGGNVGIGPSATPGYKLDVQGGDINTSGIYRVGGTSGVNLTCGANIGIKSITVSGGIITAGTCTTNTLTDLAENFGTNDASIDAGTIVQASTTQTPVEVNTAEGTATKAYVQRATQNNSAVIGIVSTAPQITLGQGIFSESENPRAVALSGRVPLKVNSSNGSINVGDYIVVSSTPGVGAKATSKGFVVAKALEAYSNADTAATGSIIVFITNTYYNPSEAEVASNTTAPDTNWTLNGTTLTTSASLVEIPNLKVNSLTATTINTTNLIAKSITTNELKVNGNVVNPTIGVGTITPGTKTIQISNTNVTANSKVLITITSDYTDAFSISKQPGVGFTINLKNINPEEVNFDYWIIGE